MSSDKKVVYLISHGSYSDYSVDAVVTTKGTAEVIVNRLNGLKSNDFDLYDVEERPLITSPSDVEARVYHLVWIDRDGNPTEESTHVKTSLDFDPLPEDNSSDTKFARDGTVAFGQSSRGRDVALKIARDKLAEIKAAEAGLN
jgi:hypothetical protein